MAEEMKGAVVEETTIVATVVIREVVTMAADVATSIGVAIEAATEGVVGKEATISETERTVLLDGIRTTNTEVVAMITTIHGSATTTSETDSPLASKGRETTCP